MIAKRFLSIAGTAVLAVTLLAVPGPATAQSTIVKPDEQTIADAYVISSGACW